MGEYPEEITLNPGSEEYDLLVGHSDIIDTLAENELGPLTLTADIMFQGDQKKWEDFVDIFFPEMGIKKYFGFKNDKIYVLPERGGKNALKNMLEFMMVDTPSTIMNFAKSQARKHPNAPPITVPKGVGHTQPGRGARNYAARQQRNDALNLNRHVNMWNNIRHTNESNENQASVNLRPEPRINNNNVGSVNNNNNRSNRTVPSRLRLFTLANYMPPSSNRRTRRNKSRRKNTRRVNRK